LEKGVRSLSKNSYQQSYPEINKAIIKFHKLVSEVYGTCFLEVLNFYLSIKEKERKDIFALLVERPQKAYEFMIDFFKNEMGVDVFLRTLLAKIYGEYAIEERVEDFINSL